MQNDSSTHYGRLISWLPVAAGVSLVACAGLCSQTVADWLDSQPPLAPPLYAAIRTSQAAFITSGAILLLFGLATRHVPTLRRVMAHGTSQRIVLSGILVLTPLLMIELGLRPIAVSRRWTMFVPDPELGWKHRPDTTDYIVQLPVRINSRGLRGKEFDALKPPASQRLLFLGDSVTFGHGLPADEQTIPAQVEQIIAARSGPTVQAINAGVCGYSPWQYLAYLKRDGLPLEPDVVVTNFVLNDVTEKFSLPRFGGIQSSAQMRSAITSTMPKWIAQSGVFFLARSGAAFLRFGLDAQRGATKEEALGVRSLCSRPDDDAVRKAWRITLDNVRQIFDTARRAGAVNLLVVYPFRFQLDTDGFQPPQQTIARLAQAADVPVLDLLPAFRTFLQNHKTTPADLFRDSCHLTPRGAQLAAREIADFLITNRMLGEAHHRVVSGATEER